MRFDWQPKLLEIAKRQLGVFSARQAEMVGMGASTRRRWREAGRLEELFPGVCRLAGAPVTWLQRAYAAHLWAGPASLLSHASAARLLGLTGLPVHLEESVSVTIPRTQRIEHPSVEVMRARKLPYRSVFRGLIPHTNLARTILDLAGVLDEEPLEQVLDSACRMRPRFIAWLQYELDQRDDRRGMAQLTELIRDRGTNQTASPLEVKVLRAMRKAGIPRPTTQVRAVDERGRFLGRVDFGWVGASVVVEADSWRHHGGKADWERDTVRRNRLVGFGLQVFTVTWGTVADPKWLESVRRALGLMRGGYLPLMALNLPGLPEAVHEPGVEYLAAA